MSWRRFRDLEARRVAERRSTGPYWTVAKDMSSFSTIETKVGLPAIKSLIRGEGRANHANLHWPSVRLDWRGGCRSGWKCRQLPCRLEGSFRPSLP